MKRRTVIKGLAMATGAAAVGCKPTQKTTPPAVDPVQSVSALPPGVSPWMTLDPFLFCVHHDDAYPRGNGELGPAATLEGRDLGQDFAGKDGWRMYHGQRIPGFPQHPHRGFETITIVRKGFIDHSDSLGAAARYGQGDVQWLTAGAGINHAEMFPLLRTEADNPTELFQIWLNLPKRSKFARPYFTMFWGNTIPRFVVTDAAGRKASIEVIAGELEGRTAPNPPPDSFASQRESGVAIWTVALEAGAQWTLPAAEAGLNRSLYFFSGAGVTVGARSVSARQHVLLKSDVPTTLVATNGPAQVLMLQGRPIGEPVVKHGPFVMNTPQEIQQAYADYQRTQFGGWPWPDTAPVHGLESRHFARHADGRIDSPVPT
jgi:redox-sensitive bicupin YhaK (pirin superfamily)